MGYYGIPKSWYIAGEFFRDNDTTK